MTSSEYIGNSLRLAIKKSLKESKHDACVEESRVQDKSTSPTFTKASFINIGSSARLAMKNSVEIIHQVCSDPPQLKQKRKLFNCFSKSSKRNTYFCQNSNNIIWNERSDIQVFSLSGIANIPLELIDANILFYMSVEELCRFRRTCVGYWILVKIFCEKHSIIPLTRSVQYTGMFQTISMFNALEYQEQQRDKGYNHSPWTHPHNDVCDWCAGWGVDLQCHTCNISFHRNCFLQICKNNTKENHAQMDLKLDCEGESDVPFLCASCMKDSQIPVWGHPIAVKMKWQSDPSRFTIVGGCYTSSYQNNYQLLDFSPGQSDGSHSQSSRGYWTTLNTTLHPPLNTHPNTSPNTPPQSLASSPPSYVVRSDASVLVHSVCKRRGTNHLPLPLPSLTLPPLRSP